MQVGSNVKIQNNVALYTGIALEDDVFWGQSGVSTNVINSRSHISRKSESQATVGQPRSDDRVQRHYHLRDHHRALCRHRCRTVVTDDVPD